VSVLPRPQAACEAVVLRRWPTGESSLVVSLLTADHGFVKVLAKSARRPQSALRPLVQPGRLVHAEFSLVPGRELQYLRGGELVLDALGASIALESHAYLLAALELVDRCRESPPAQTEGAAAGEDLFVLCRDYVAAVAAVGGGGDAARFYAFELELLARLGMEPELQRCTVCGRPAGAANGGAAELPWFSAAHGGLLCVRCGGAPDARPVSAGATARMREFGRAVSAGWPRARLPRAQRREIGVLLHRFLAYHLPGYRLPAALDLLGGTRNPVPDPTAVERRESRS
jgi:DNA repair protein RecO (recombination protein O)